MIAEHAVRITLASAALRRDLGSPVASEASAEDFHEVVLPMRLGARGGQLKLVIGSAQSGPGGAPNAVLLSALARAHRWLGRLVTGEVATVRELALAEGVHRTYFSRALPLVPSSRLTSPRRFWMAASL